MARNTQQQVLAAARVDWAAGVASLGGQDGGFAGIVTVADGDANLTLIPGNFASRRDCYVEVHSLQNEIPGQLNSSSAVIVEVANVPTGVIHLTQLVEQPAAPSVLAGRQCYVVVKRTLDVG